MVVGCGSAFQRSSAAVVKVRSPKVRQFVWVMGKRKVIVEALQEIRELKEGPGYGGTCSSVAELC